MENELAVIEQKAEIELPQAVPLHAVALNRTEMIESNGQIREFLQSKLTALRAERNEVGEAGAIASENGWSTNALTNVEKRLMRQIEYYEKLVLALDAGYTIVPNMPCDQFAIRVNRLKPIAHVSNWATNYEPGVRLPDEKEQILAPGDGRYESPTQLIDTVRSKQEMPDKTVRHNITVRATDFDVIEFPFAAAVPVVMTATQAAMALKLFDRIGIVPQSVQRNEDPIILGQIVYKHKGQEKVTSFMIAWHLDLRTL